MDFINNSGIGNLILAFSNATAILPMLTATENEDFYTMLAILLVSSASFTSHLCQSKYNGLWGFGVPMKFFLILNVMDVISCWIVIARFITIYVTTYGYALSGLKNDPVLLFSSVMALIINFISCRDRSDRTYFVWIHSLWHLAVFIYLDAWLKYIYAKNK